MSDVWRQDNAGDKDEVLNPDVDIETLKLVYTGMAYVAEHGT